MAAKDFEIPIACNLAAFTAPQRVHHAELLRRLGAKVLEMRELADGYAYRLAPEAGTFAELAEWIGLERACCPFLRFTIEVEPGGGPLWLRLTGGSGVKEFVAETFRPPQR